MALLLTIDLVPKERMQWNQNLLQECIGTNTNECVHANHDDSDVTVSQC